VPHDRLVERFTNAANYHECDARVAELDRYLANLHRVERDFYGVQPSNVPLPEWH
jgi:hypothetical protein